MMLEQVYFDLGDGAVDTDVSTDLTLAMGIGRVSYVPKYYRLIAVSYNFTNGDAGQRQTFIRMGTPANTGQLTLHGAHVTASVSVTVCHLLNTLDTTTSAAADIATGVLADIWWKEDRRIRISTDAAAYQFFAVQFFVQFSP